MPNLFSILKGLFKPSIKYSVGYQMPNVVGKQNSASQIILNYKHVSEFCFSLPDMPSDCPPYALQRYSEHEDMMQELFRDLKVFKEMSIPSVLLFNASCYGPLSVSQDLQDFLVKSIEEIKKNTDLKAVVTMSLFVADVVRKNFPELEIRADANMHVGTIRQMQFASVFFDGFYLDPDYNRDLGHIRKVRQWCQEAGKTLHMVVNPSCIHTCPYRKQHYNQVAHGDDTPYCAQFLTPEQHRQALLRGNWIRPEDMPHYQGLFDSYRLITRSSLHVSKIINAYVLKHCPGDIREILSPDVSVRTKIPAIMGKSLPKDWFEKTSTCGHHCEDCGYCK